MFVTSLSSLGLFMIVILNSLLSNLIHFYLFKAGVWSFILFLWLSPNSLLLCMSCYLLMKFGFWKNSHFFWSLWKSLKLFWNVSSLGFGALYPAGLWPFPTPEYPKCLLAVLQYLWSIATHSTYLCSQWTSGI